jgi:uncharacterized protein YdhG (YjbR/CyaY superfamily)
MSAILLRDTLPGMTVDEYITAHPALPNAEESMSYNMPTYKSEGKPVIYFAGWKRHYSLYPASSQIIEVSTVPVKRIQRIAKLRAMEVDGQ